MKFIIWPRQSLEPNLTIFGWIHIIILEHLSQKHIKDTPFQFTFLLAVFLSLRKIKLEHNVNEWSNHLWSEMEDSDNLVFCQGNKLQNVSLCVWLLSLSHWIAALAQTFHYRNWEIEIGKKDTIVTHSPPRRQTVWTLNPKRSYLLKILSGYIVLPDLLIPVPEA